jgi:hypothetical protein
MKTKEIQAPKKDPAQPEHQSSSAATVHKKRTE